jgi:signal peptidase
MSRLARAAAPVRAIAGRLVAPCVLAALATLLLAGLVPVLWGWRPLVVTSGSMSPLIQPGDVVLVDPARSTPGPGAVITYRAPGRPDVLITHRVVGTDPAGGYRTRGDANGTPDPQPVKADALVGQVRLLVPWLGRPALQARAHPGPAAALALITAALALLLPRTRRGRRGTHRRPSGRIGRRGRCPATLLVLAAVLSLPGAARTRAAFAATTTDPGNSVAVGSTTYSAAMVTSAPVSYWRLGEASGTAGTDVMGTANLTYNGVGLGVTGALAHDANTAIHTTTNAQYATAANAGALSLSTNLTVLAWFKGSVATQASTSRVLAKYDGTTVNYMLAWDTAGTAMRFLLDLTGGRYTAQITVPTPTSWHLYTGVWTGSNANLYVDGALAASTGTTGTAKTNASATTVGVSGASALGDIDEVGIWNRALTAAEIATLYTLGTS